MKNEEAESSSNLSVVISQNALTDLRSQRTELNSFIKSCLSQDVDFGEIPGTQKPSLFKPGAEKLAKLFQLGSRIADKSQILELEKSFAMFTYAIEVFHIPSGKTVAQCEGSANSQEKKFKSRPTPDMLNTLQKMAQKRAYVGAIIIATGASDFFTQDVEDMDLSHPQTGKNDVQIPKVTNPTTAPSASGAYVCTFGKFKGIDIRTIDPNELISYADYIRRESLIKNKPILGQVKDFMDAVAKLMAADDIAF